LSPLHTGEAFIEFSGEDANVQQALTKDKAGRRLATLANPVDP
jgi:hypothetical protein